MSIWIIVAISITGGFVGALLLFLLVLVVIAMGDTQHK
jgi:hypothetical protein